MVKPVSLASVTILFECLIQLLAIAASHITLVAYSAPTSVNGLALTVERHTGSLTGLPSYQQKVG
jgi:hypothetical protein